MTRVREGVILHAILEDFETAAMVLRRRGLSSHTADRVGLFIALTTAPQPARLSFKEAWAMVDKHFPPTATRQGGAGTPPNDSTPTQPERI